MTILQYIVQFLGASLVVYGYLSARVMKNAEAKHSYWTRIDEAKARSELPEYIMSIASKGMDGLVGLSALLCAFGLAIGIAFPNLIYANIEDVLGAAPVATGVFGAQILSFIILISCVFMIFLFVEGARSGTLFSENHNIIELIAIGVFSVSALTALYVIFQYSITGFFNVQHIIDPIFSKDVSDFFSDIVLNFAATTIILSLPALVVVLVILFTVLIIASQSPLKFDTTTIEDFLYVAFVFVIGFIGSIFYTLSSGAIGNSLQGQSSYPVTFQLVLANALFDGLTLYTTVSLMRWASASWRTRSALAKIEKSFQTALTSGGGNFPNIYLESRRLQEVIDEIKKIKNEAQFKEFLERGLGKEYWILGNAAEDLSSGLSELSKIFTNGNMISLDRALYRTAVLKDYEIPLLGYGRSQSSDMKFDSERSWIVCTLKCLGNDISSKKSRMTNEVNSGRRDIANIRGADLENFVEVLETFNAHFKSTWEAINKDRKLFKQRPFVAITADLLLASVFAYCSMFFGLIGRAENLSIEYLNRLFVGGNSFGEFSSIGPLFWIMHTTFIPSLFLVAFLMFLLLSGYAISPFVNWVGRILNLVDQKQTEEHYIVSANLSLAKTGTVIAAVGTILMIFNKILNFSG